MKRTFDIVRPAAGGRSAAGNPQRTLLEVNMRRLLLIGRALCVMVCVSSASAARADNFIEFLVSREPEDDRYRAGIYVDIPGATTIELLPQGGGALPFEVQGGGSFWLQRSDFATLGDLNTNIAGTHTLRITHTGGVSDYEYTRAQIEEGIFANVPVLNPVPAGIPQNYNFQWTWSGAADEMYADAQIHDKLSKEEDDEGSFVIGVTTDWTPDFSPETGTGHFVIDYSYIGDVELGNGISITGWALLSGDELFGGANDEIDDCIDSQDMAYFTVVPEPGATALLALGGLSLLRRRRKRKRHT